MHVVEPTKLEMENTCIKAEHISVLGPILYWQTERTLNPVGYGQTKLFPSNREYMLNLKMGPNMLPIEKAKLKPILTVHICDFG